MRRRVGNTRPGAAVSTNFQILTWIPGDVSAETPGNAANTKNPARMAGFVRPRQPGNDRYTLDDQNDLLGFLIRQVPGLGRRSNPYALENIG